ncbi:MAG: hypothetical protein ACLUEQ_03205 [Cloacibacillus evryensis]
MKGEIFLMEIISWFAAVCRENPSIPFFFCIGAGYWLGSFKYKGVALGAVAATLIVAVIVGALLGVEISPNVKNIFFLLFIFTIGYSSGPAFFHSLRSSAVPPRFCAADAALCLASAYVMAKLMGLNPGFGAGLLAGSATESLMISRRRHDRQARSRRGSYGAVRQRRPDRVRDLLSLRHHRRDMDNRLSRSGTARRQGHPRGGARA